MKILRNPSQNDSRKPRRNQNHLVHEGIVNITINPNWLNNYAVLWVLIFCMVYLNGDFVTLHNCSEWNFTVKSLECYVSLILSIVLLDIQATFEVKFQSIQICDGTKTQVMRNPNFFGDYNKSYLLILMEKLPYM